MRTENQNITTEMKLAAFIIIVVIAIIWKILITVINQPIPEAFKYCSVCHVCERRLCE